MSTTQRLGIDITAVNKTGAAFASVQKNLAGIQSNLQSLKFLMAGFVSGNFLEGMVRSFVEVSKQTAPVKAALDGLAGSWSAFAAKVGEAGLNDALINFATRMSGMMQGTNGLAESIGALMGGAINGMGKAFEVIGRAIGFAYDNLGFFLRAGGIFMALKLGEQIAWTGMTVLRFAATMRIGAIAMGLFTVALNMGKKGLLALTAVGLAAALSMETVTDVIKATMQNIESMMGPLYSTFQDGLKALGLDTSALNDELAGYVALGSKIKSTQTNIGKGASDASLGVSKLGKSFETVTEPMSTVASQMSEIGSTIKSSLGSALSGLISGTMSVKDAFASMAQSIMNNMADMLAQMAVNSIFKLLAGAFSPAPAVSPGMARFKGVFATGGTLGAGEWGIAGEAGPEIVHGPAGITPMGKVGGGGVNVQIINNTGAHVTTQTQQNSDGSVNVRTFIQDEVNSAIGSGRTARLMAGRFGSRVLPKRT